MRECPATPSPLPKCHVQKGPRKNVVPRSPGVHIKKRCCSRALIVQKVWQNVLTQGMQSALTSDSIINVRSVHLSATRAACVAHALREHTDELIGPCDYCGSFYAHSADMMKHHVNECAGSTTGSDDNDD